MKKYVLNIERLYAGQTSNAIVLKRVEGEFPSLLPSLQEGQNVADWILKCKEIHPDFLEGENVDDVDELNEKVVEFNRGLQQRFKEGFGTEVYMMDDTQRFKPDDDGRSYGSDKTYLHSLNGNA